MTATVAKKDKLINPKQWRVVGQFRHAGITYGTNEQLPPLTIEQAEAYVAQGTLARRDADASVSEFLDAPDGAILQRIVDENPDRKFLETALVTARLQSRSKVLELALTIAIRGASAARSPR